MINLETLIGVKVFVDSCNESIGTLRDVVMDIDEGRVRYIIIDHRRYFHSIKIVEYSSIAKIKHNSIILDNIEALSDIKKKSGFLDLFTYVNGMELEIYDENSALVGFFKDVYVNEKTGEIIAYIVSNGFIDDITNGLMIIRDIDKFYLEKGKMNIKVPLENCSIEIIGGLKNLLEL